MTAKRPIILTAITAAFLALAGAACDGVSPTEPRALVQPVEPTDTTGFVKPHPGM